jgi:hypothetical protein
MRKLMTWFVGTFIGGMVGLFSVLAFSAKDDEIRQHFHNARIAARQAQLKKRAELEAELAVMRNGANQTDSA